MKRIWFLLLSAWLPLTALAENSAVVPTSRTAPTNWVARHEGFLAEAKQGNYELVFIGDSITDRWRKQGLEVWNKFYVPRHALNLGISGDRTQHVLWRLDHGELAGLKPKAVVLMIGTNNTGQEKPKCSDITGAPNSRVPRPPVPNRTSIDQYTSSELVQLIQWVCSDGRLRTDEEIVTEMVAVLGFSRRGARIEAA